VVIRDLVLELLSALRAPPAADDEPLELDSLALVTLVEALEDRLGIAVSAAEVVPENFASLARVVAFVEGKR
jgi:acyl carrier protein